MNVWQGGELSLARVSSNQGAEYIRLELGVAGERVVAEISLENFALLVTGRNNVNCSVQRRQQPGIPQAAGGNETAVGMELPANAIRTTGAVRQDMVTDALFVITDGMLPDNFRRGRQVDVIIIPKT